MIKRMLCCLMGDDNFSLRRLYFMKHYKIIILYLVIEYIISIPVLAHFHSNPMRTAESHLDGISYILEEFKKVFARYPNTQEGLNTLYYGPKKEVNSKRWNGKSYLAGPSFEDPWKQEYRYLSPGVHHKDSFDLFSVGRDGIEGTIDDINNWDDYHSWRAHYEKILFWQEFWAEHVLDFILVGLTIMIIIEVRRTIRSQQKH